MRLWKLCSVVVLAAWCSLPIAAKKIKIGGPVVGADLASCAALTDRKKYADAVECLEVFKSRNKGTSNGQTADLLIGDNYFASKDYLLAADAYESFVKNFPEHSRADYAQYRLGLAYLSEAPKQIDRDQQYLEQAATELHEYVARFPKSGDSGDARTQLDNALRRRGAREYYIGKFYYRTGEYRAALPRLLHVLTEYPTATQRGPLYWEVVRATGELGDLEGAKQLYSQMQQELPGDARTKQAERYLLKLARRAP